MLVSRRVYLHSNGTSYTPFPALLQIVGEMRVITREERDFLN